ncbi:MAG TPA: transposase [Acidobacteriota bacterium]|nr:transposase [Acidobacteriota bacterium]
MPRGPRFEFAGAYYHVMCRGNRGEKVFFDEEDHYMFLRCLSRTCDKAGWKAHAFVLMPNHYHLLLETPEANLVAGMRWLQSVYTQSFNKRHDLFGHLFQGRYKSLVIDPMDSRHIITVSGYIHLNPIRAGVVKNSLEGLIAYRWSSLPFYALDDQNKPLWLEKTRVLRDLGFQGDPNTVRRAYLDHISSLVDKLDTQEGFCKLNDEWRAIRRGWHLGSKEFKNRLLTINGSSPHLSNTQSRTSGLPLNHGDAGAVALIQDCLEVLGINEEDLELLQKSDPRKQAVAWWVRKHTSVTNRWLSNQLHMGHPTNVTQAVGLFEKSDSPSLRALRKTLEKGKGVSPIILG